MKANITETQEIIRAIENIPPLLWLLYCKEPDQKERWSNLKIHFGTLHDSLEAYFSGNESPLQSLPRKQREFYTEWTDYYLAVYDVLQWGWKYIQKADPEFPFENPGKALIAIIESDAAGMFASCQLGYYQWSAKNTYDEHRLRKKKDALAKGETLDKRQQNRLSKLSAASEKRDAYTDPLISLLKFCLTACQQNGAQNDGIMKRKLQDMRKHSDIATDTLVTSFLRTSQGHAWDKGKRKEWAAGGVYKAR